MTAETFERCQKLSLNLLLLTFTFLLHSNAQASACTLSVANRDYSLPSEVSDPGSGKMEMRWKLDSKGQLIQTFSNEPKRILGLSEAQTTQFLAGELLLSLKWVNTHREGRKEPIYSDISFASSGNNQLPYPSQLVAHNTLLPIKVANEEAWFFYAPKKNDPGLRWKHRLESRGQRILRADLLGRFPLDGNSYHESFSEIRLIEPHSIVHKSDYLKFKFLDREYSLPLFIYEDVRARSVVKRPSHFEFSLGVSPTGQLFLSIKVNPLYMTHAPVRIVLSENKSEWLRHFIQ